jgi:pimeloyl-ACP methyl ester carboxylesterase
MPTMQVNGATIAYTDTGAPPNQPAAPTIVFGHGLLFSGWMFQAQVAALRADYRCVAIDWRGHGDTPASPDGYDMDSLTADVVALIDMLGVAPVHYVGLSMGGFVGLRLAARHGELLRSLTLLDTSADAESPDHVGQYRQLAAIYRLVGMIGPVRSKVLPLMFGPEFRTAPENQPVLDEWTARLRRGSRAGIRKAVLGVANRPSVHDELVKISVPTLMIVGLDDMATPPDQAERIAAGIAGARLEKLAACGHSSAVERPDEVNSLLRDFLAAAPDTIRPADSDARQGSPRT